MKDREPTFGEPKKTSTEAGTAGAGALRADVEALALEMEELRLRERQAIQYIRLKIDQLLSVMGTSPLRPEELDDKTLLALDPIGIISNSFTQILNHLKETNSELKGAREEIEAIFESAGAGILVLDQNMRILAYNRKQEDYFASGEEDIIGRSCCEVMCHGEKPSGMCTFDMVMQGMTSAHQKDWVCRARHFDVVGTPVRNERGEVTRVVIVYTDITEYKRIVDDLRESEFRYRDLFDNAHDLIFITDREGKLQYVNRAWENAMGYSSREAAGMHLRDLCSRETADQCFTHFQHVLGGEMIESLETVFVSRDGRRVMVEGSATCHISKGVPMSVRGIFRDVSDRKRAEEHLRSANEKLERQNRELQKLDGMKDGLIRDVSHELKTPVAKHLMQMEMLQPLVHSDRLSQEERKAFAVMEESIKRQESVIRNLLNLSRLEHGDRAYRRSEIMLDDMVSRVLADYQYTLEVLDVKFLNDMPRLRIFSDEDMLWHVFSNLINNAIKFRRRNEPVRIAISGESLRKEILIRITDNGIGMLPEEKAQVFERFYQASSSIEGSGVGLAICRRIVEELGGRIWIDSQGRDRGVTVTVALPQRSP